MRTWAKLLLLLLAGGIAFFMLAHPDLQYTYWGGIAAVPVGLCLPLVLTLVLGWDKRYGSAARHLVKKRRQRQIRDSAEQTLLEWNERYGPPVVTPVRKPAALPPSPFPMHVCDGKAYAREKYCPVHGYGSLPVSVAPSASGSPVIGGSMSSDEFARQIARAAEESYVPEGSAELLQNLAEALRDQAAEAVKGSHWEMNAEWVNEVKKLKALNGSRAPLWKWRESAPASDKYSAYLLGFPVRVSDEYGAPSLEGP